MGDGSQSLPPAGATSGGVLWIPDEVGDLPVPDRKSELMIELGLPGLLVLILGSLHYAVASLRDDADEGPNARQSEEV